MLDDPGPPERRPRHLPTYIVCGLTELHKELSLIKGDGRRRSPSTRAEPGPRHRSTVCPRGACRAGGQRSSTPSQTAGNKPSSK